jgi:peptide-methionine (S)-S-oxide reductase
MIRRQLMQCLLLGSLLLSAISGGVEPMGQAETKGEFPADGRELITLGGGCFWCVEAVFYELRGVEKVESGYSGGSRPNPSYEQVCSGATGHAEVIQLTYDPKVISLQDLLKIFFTVHDPTTLNRQGADVGTQYRSVIFYRSDEQKAAAQQTISEIQAAGLWNDPIVTEVAPFKAFYKAENYHQKYFELNGSQPYCRMVIAPKIAKFRDHYRALLKK